MLQDTRMHTTTVEVEEEFKILQEKKNHDKQASSKQIHATKKT